ncbi:hypothetical protein Pmani_003080 [Petrolisthes manimaculis]|uniref:Mutator-like transposase domain-containing protein n=1 Tax=Petrolisthes manimaculis TaxID=1843537 RepID=A0AAE1UIU0_9EUCA|nr:hypothetical protein Pmani_003080 [Petrolisthes manimaculis]
MKIMTSTRFFYIAREIEVKGIQDGEVSLRRAWELVHEYVENEQPGSPEVKNITVTCDSSWSKRGFEAKFCVVPVIHFDTGLVVDYQVLSKYYRICEKNKNTEGDWYAVHQPV